MLTFVQRNRFANLSNSISAHPRVVELPKTDEGLGFNVMGGKEQNSPIYISRIIPGGVADRHGGLKRGDQLLSVNAVVSIRLFTLSSAISVDYYQCCLSTNQFDSRSMAKITRKPSNYWSKRLAPWSWSFDTRPKCSKRWSCVSISSERHEDGNTSERHKSAEAISHPNDASKVCASRSAGDSAILKQISPSPNQSCPSRRPCALASTPNHPQPKPLTNRIGVRQC